jgi:hypothetical protein
VARGKKTGGRQKGSLNVRTRQLQEAVCQTVEGAKPDELPAEFLRRVAQNEDIDLHTRIAAANACAGYFSPKLANVDLHSTSENVHYHLHDMPVSAEEWLVEVGQDANIAGRTVPLATTVGHVHAIEIEVRDKKIAQLEERIAALTDALALSQSRENEARKIPLLS